MTVVRQFDGTDDVVTLALGGANVAAGPITIAAVVKITNQAHYSTFITGLNSSAVREWSFYVESSAAGSSLIFESDGGEQASTMTLTPQEMWCLVAVTKTSGTTTPKFHKYVYNTATWTHQDAAGTMTNGAAPGAGGSIVLGAFQASNFFEGQMAAAAVWTTALADADLEGIVGSFSSWTGFSTPPVAAWRLDGAVASGVQDTIGAADETSVTGTLLTHAYEFGFDDSTPAAPSVYGFGTIATHASSTTLAPTYPSGIQANDIAILLAGSAGGAASPITWPGDFTEIEQQSTGGMLGGAAYQRLAGDETAPTVTFAADGGGQYAMIVVYRDVITTGTPYEALSDSGAANSDTIPSSTQCITTGTERTVVCCIFVDDDTAPSSGNPPASWVIDAAQTTTTGTDFRLQTDSIYVPSAATVAATDMFTLPANDFNRTITFALLPVPAAAGGTKPKMLLLVGCG
jgi:hypothetical protein